MSRPVSPIEFDISLPYQHTYIGQTLEEIEGSTFTEEDSIITLPLIEFHNVILVPGQIIPLQIRHPVQISMFNNIVQGDRLFGFKYPHANYGTISEVRSISSSRGSGGDVHELYLKAKGCNVFKITETWRDQGGILMARVLVLPDEDTNHPLNCNSLSFSRGFKYNAKLLPASTGIPYFIYLQYEPNTLQKRILDYLKDWSAWRQKVESGQGHSLLSLPLSPRDFSYWVAANLPLEDEDRLICLTLKSSIKRLRILLNILQSMNSICCKECKQLFCSKQDIFSMSQSGPQNTFINPGGYVHEALTVYKVESLSPVDEPPSAEFSWFPGYEWTICSCSNCFSAIGWKFTPENGRKLNPSVFWALRRKCIQLTYKKKLLHSSSIHS